MWKQILTSCFLEVEQGSLLNQVFVFEYLSILPQNTLCAHCVIEFSDEPGKVKSCLVVHRLILKGL